MLRKKHIAAAQTNPYGYMVTFTDMITLLLTFFVMLVCMSSMGTKTIQNAFGVFSGGTGALSHGERGQLEDLLTILAKADQVPPAKLMENKQIEGEVFRFDDPAYRKIVELLRNDIRVKPAESGVAIELASYILFDTGEANIRPENLPMLNRLADVIRAAGRYPVSIECHTDGHPAEGGQTEAAWQLSLARAIAVLEYFTKDAGLPPERFRVGGYGPAKPAYPGDTPEKRVKNRRVEIILYREKFG